MNTIITLIFLLVFFQITNPSIIPQTGFYINDHNLNRLLQENTTSQKLFNQQSALILQKSLPSRTQQQKNVQIRTSNNQFLSHSAKQINNNDPNREPIIVYAKKKRFSSIISQDSSYTGPVIVKKEESFSNSQNISVYGSPQPAKKDIIVQKQQAIVLNVTKKQQTKSNSTQIQSTNGTFTVKNQNLKLNKQIITSQFKGIGLFHAIPFYYRVGQTFRFNGILLDYQNVYQNIKKSNILNIVFTQWNGNNQFRCVGQIQKTLLQFDISCKIRSQGKYFLSIFYGPSGQSSIQFRFVSNTSSSQIKMQQNIQPPKPQRVRLDVINNNLQISWISKAALTNITIYQKQYKQIKKVQFILSNYHQKFIVPFKDFQQFEIKYVEIDVTHANSLDGTYFKISSKFSKNKIYGQFFALQHSFGSIYSDKISINPLIPWKIGVDKKFKFEAVFQEDVRNQVFLISPNLNIKTIYFIPAQNKKIPIKTIKAGTSVNLQISFTSPGTHFIQINAASGTALLNRPIYVGNGFPLIPDYQDLLSESFTEQYQPWQLESLSNYFNKTIMKSKIKQPSRNSTLQQKRDFVLSLINDLRKKYNAEPVQMNKQLNDFSQIHSDDMSTRKYFNHVSMEGNGPEQRANLFQIKSPIGQNIAQSNTLIQAVLGFQRSAVHLQNSVSDQWSRIGIGISKTQNNQYVVVLQFSTRNLRQKPLQDKQIKNYQKQLVKIIQQQNPNIISQNKDLSDEITKWMSTQRQKHVFAFLFQRKNYDKLMVLFSFKTIFKDNWIQQLRTHSDFLQGYYKYKQVGVGLGLDPNENNNTLEIYLIFS